MDDDLIISFVKEHPYLYNNRIKEYKNKEKKQRAWSKIALALGYEVSDLKRRWKVLRDRFVRRLRIYDTEELFTKLPHYAQMSFLTNIVSHRTKQTASSEEFDGSLSAEPVISFGPSSDDESVTYVNSENYEPPSELTKSYSEAELDALNTEEVSLQGLFSEEESVNYPESVYTEPPPKKRKNCSDVKFLTYSDIAGKSVNKSQSVSDDVHFLLSLRSSLSQISDERKKICLKGEILNVVQDYLE